MVDHIKIRPTGPVQRTIRPPGSKSITNRALACAAMAGGTSTLRGALNSEDTRVMMDALQALGVDVTMNDRTNEVTVRGVSGELRVPSGDIFVANSGTTVRFLTAMVSTCPGEFRLDGVPRMRERPIQDLLEALGQLGADVNSERQNGCPPVVVRGDGLLGGTATVRGDVSSQFLSSLLMATPYARRPVRLAVDGKLVSQPYVRMTLHVMSAFGVEVKQPQTNLFEIEAPMQYEACRYEIEPDASAASYFWAAAAITGGEVTVSHLSQNALQGDVDFCRCLQEMGCRVKYESDRITVKAAPLRGINVDMSAISDTAQTLAAVALFAEGPTTITGVAHIRHKETDRIGDLARELRKLGAQVDELPDGLRITPSTIQPAEIDTYDDHRMAMSLSLVGLETPGIVIRDPDCTKKTYPGFFSELARWGAVAE